MDFDLWLRLPSQEHDMADHTSGFFIGQLLAHEVLLRTILQGIPEAQRPALLTLLQQALREAEQSRTTSLTFKETERWEGFLRTLEGFMNELGTLSDTGH